MKRLLLIVLVLAFAAPAFADDALVLPQGVWRTRVIPAFVFGGNSFDDDFSFDRESSDDVRIMTLGFAVEYGINDWITAAAQWAPAFSVWSDLSDDRQIARWADLFLGAKFQLIGPEAPVSRNDMRLALAPGVKVPFPAADWDDSIEDFQAGDEFVAQSLDRNVLGVGGRFYFDYVFSPAFYLNFFTELIMYPIEGGAPNLGYYLPVAFGGAGLDDDKFDYGYDLKLEIEPHYIYTASPNLRITPSLPITFTHSPDLKYDGNTLDDTASSLLTVAPTVEFFFTGLTVPTALELTYSIPVAGQNSPANHAVILQIKNYLKFW